MLLCASCAPRLIANFKNFRPWLEAIIYNILSCYLCAPSYPGLLTSAFVTCSTNVGEGLVNWSRAVRYLDLGWMCGGVAHSFCSCIAVRQLSESKKRHQDCLMLTAQSCVVCGCISSTLTHSFSVNMPLLHTSTQQPGTSLYMISFTTATDKCWGKNAWVQG